MPALIREWKAVSLRCIVLSGVEISLTVVTGWKEEVDQVAEITDHMIVMDCGLLYDYVSSIHPNNEALIAGITTYLGASFEVS